MANCGPPATRSTTLRPTRRRRDVCSHERASRSCRATTSGTRTPVDREHVRRTREPANGAAPPHSSTSAAADGDRRRQRPRRRPPATAGTVSDGERTSAMSAGDGCAATRKGQRGAYPPWARSDLLGAGAPGAGGRARRRPRRAGSRSRAPSATSATRPSAPPRRAIATDGIARRASPSDVELGEQRRDAELEGEHDADHRAARAGQRGEADADGGGQRAGGEHRRGAAGDDADGGAGVPSASSERDGDAAASAIAAARAARRRPGAAGRGRRTARCASGRWRRGRGTRRSRCRRRRRWRRRSRPTTEAISRACPMASSKPSAAGRRVARVGAVQDGEHDEGEQHGRRAVSTAQTASMPRRRRSLSMSAG